MALPGPPSAAAHDEAMTSIFTDEHRILRDQLRRFVENEVKPVASAWEEEGMVPRTVLRRMGTLGFLGLRVPEEYGGAGMDARASVVLAEELGRSTFGGFDVTVLVHTDMASPHLVNAGSPAQKRRWLPGAVAGELITAIAVTEPNAGSDVAAIRTRAERQGREWVLNGTKMFITNGPEANLVFVAARTDPAAKGSRGLSIFAVEKGTPGFTVGRRLDKMGWRSSDTGELVFDDCRIPEENLLGEENHGFYAVMRNFQNERLVAAAVMMSTAQTALDLTLAYVRDRNAFGRPLWEMQTIRQNLAMLAAKIEAGRLLVHRCAALDAAGQDCVREVSMAKAYCGELINEVMYKCLQYHGGMGYMRETPIERMTRDARVHAIGGGATEVMLEEVAKRL
jgi:acyl-CoA dehydrogenase